MNNLFKEYQIPKPTKKAPPHALAYHCQRLSDKLHIPFSTIILRFLKKDEQLTESLVQYMSEKGIKNIGYLVTSFHNQRRLRNL